MARQQPTIDPEDLKAALDPDNWAEMQGTGKLRQVGGSTLLLLRYGETGDMVIAGMPQPGGDGSRPHIVIPGYLVDATIRALRELYEAK